MQTRTGLRAGMTPQELLQNFQNSAGAVVDTVGNAADVLNASAQGAAAGAQDAVQGAQQWWANNNVGETLNQWFWFPLDPPQ